MKIDIVSFILTMIVTMFISFVAGFMVNNHLVKQEAIKYGSAEYKNGKFVWIYPEKEK